MESARGDYSISSDARQSSHFESAYFNFNSCSGFASSCSGFPSKVGRRSGAEFEATYCLYGIGEGQSQHHLQISIRRACWDTAQPSRSLVLPQFRYAAYFFAAFNFAHLARCAAAIFLRADADMV